MRNNVKKKQIILCAGMVFIAILLVLYFMFVEKSPVPEETVAESSMTVPVEEQELTALSEQIAVTNPPAETMAEPAVESQVEPMAYPETDEAETSLAKEEEIQAVSLIMVGDILLHTPVEESARKEDGTYDFTPVFSKAKSGWKRQTWRW